MVSRWFPYKACRSCTPNKKQRRWDTPGEKWRRWPLTENGGVPWSMAYAPNERKGISTISKIMKLLDYWKLEKRDITVQAFSKVLA